MSRSRNSTSSRKHLADMSATPRTSTWAPPLPEECDEYDYLVDLGVDLRVIGRFVVHQLRSDVVEFSLSLETLDKGAWSEVARVDTKHDEVHCHQMFQPGSVRTRREVWMPIESVQDVGQGYDRATAYLTENSETLVGRWKRGR